MTLQKFNTLSLNQKSDTVWEWGYFISSIKNVGYTTAFFFMGDFIAEVNFSGTQNNTDSIQVKTLNENESISSLQNSIFLKVKH